MHQFTIRDVMNRRTLSRVGEGFDVWSSEQKECKEIYGAFKNEFRPYRDRVGKIVNKIKHEQGRLRFVYSDAMFGGSFGYYVEGAGSDGVIGPDCEIHHPRGETAYSLGRDFRLHVCGVFFVAARLAHAIYRATGKAAVASISENAKLADLVKRVRDIPPGLLPRRNEPADSLSTKLRQRSPESLTVSFATCDCMRI